jgi:hypothetical protein
MFFHPRVLLDLGYCIFINPTRIGTEKRVRPLQPRQFFNAIFAIGPREQMTNKTSSLIEYGLCGTVAFRLRCFGVWAISAAIVVAGAAARPSLLPGAAPGCYWSWASHGLGTHGQIVNYFGISAGSQCAIWKRWKTPCPTCGMTTAVSLVMHGRPLSALVCQPFGCAVGIAAIVLLAWSSAGMILGRLPRHALGKVKIEPVLVAIALLFAASWLWKILVIASN